MWQLCLFERVVNPKGAIASKRMLKETEGGINTDARESKHKEKEEERHTTPRQRFGNGTAVFSRLFCVRKRSFGIDNGTERGFLKPRSAAPLTNCAEDAITYSNRSNLSQST